MAPLAEIAEAVGTPFYAYDADLFRQRIHRLEEALAGTRHQTCYAVKANDALALLGIVAAEGLGADIVSGGELAKALRAGIPGERIVFSGVGKRPDELNDALAAGVRSINVESPGELDAIAAAATALGVRARVSVRLNPDVAADTHAYIATGSASSKFGLPADAARAELLRAAADPALEPVGVSFHLGSQLFDLATVHAAIEGAAELWRSLADDGVSLRDLDVGGGLGVSYEDGRDADLEAYAQVVGEAARALGAELVLEPGRWLAAPCGTLVARVLSVKDAGGRLIAVCDAGMNDLIRPALYGAYHPIDVVSGDGRKQMPVDVVGPVCESGDFFALARELPEPRAGDLLAVGMTGAYGRVMASTYNGRPLCVEVLLENGEWRVVRDRGTYEDLVRGERL